MESLDTSGAGFIGRSVERGHEIHPRKAYSLNLPGKQRKVSCFFGNWIAWVFDVKLMEINRILFLQVQIDGL